MLTESGFSPRGVSDCSVSNRGGSPGDSVRKDHVDLDAQVDRLRGEGLDAHAVVLFDEPEDGITTTALLEEADLVTLAPQVREGFDALMHPSVTARMLSRSPAPLLILPDGMPSVAAAPLPEDPTARMLVPLDGSARGTGADPGHGPGALL
jgi:hypothetical protein